MQWLNALDDVLDRVLVGNEEDENDSLADADSVLSIGGDDVMSSRSSDPGPLQHDDTPPKVKISNLSDSLIQSTEDEEGGDFVAATFGPTEQAPGQDSTSPVLPLIIEPDSSMLDDEDDLTLRHKLPTSEPSASSEVPEPVVRDSISCEDEQSTTRQLLVQGDEDTERQVVGDHDDLESRHCGSPEDMQYTLHASNPPTVFTGSNSDLQQLNDETEEWAAEDEAPCEPDSKETSSQATDRPVSGSVLPRDRYVSFDNEQDSDQVDVPTQVVGHDDDIDFSEFNVPSLLSPWDSSTRLDPWLNCYGVVHVRLLCAQRLPCPVGSSVQGILSLHPWKGRVRTATTETFVVPPTHDHVDHGVCARWEQLEDAGYCSMVNSWTSFDNPTPEISIELVFHPLQMLEYRMCFVTLSCSPLMKEPGEWKKQWCRTTITQKTSDTDRFLEAEERVPLILLEAMFVPARKEDNLADGPTDNQLPCDDSEASVEPSLSTSSSLTPSLRNYNQGGSVMTGASYLSHRTKCHLLRVQSLLVPATCAVCSTVLVGWRSAYRCEACDIDCCRDCQLQVDLKVPCGSSAAKEAVAASIHNKLTVENVMNAVAPWDEKSHTKSSQSESKTGSGALSPDAVKVEATKGLEEERAIGNLRMHVACACIFEKPLHPESKTEDVFKEKNDLVSRRGDYYVRITPDGDQRSSRRTRTIQNSGNPRFDSEELMFNVPHYGAEYRFDVVDSYTDRSIGMVVVTVQTMLQQQRDNMVAADGFAMINPFSRPTGFTEKRRWRLDLRSGLKHGDFFSSSKARTKGEVVGWLDVDLCLDENVDELYGSRPVRCPTRPPDALNMELFQAHVARIGSLFGDVRNAIDVFSYVISWKNPALTTLSLLLFFPLCLRLNAEHVASLPVFVLVVYMAFLAKRRKDGHLKDRFVEREMTACLQSEKKVSVHYSIHRPIGQLKVAVRQGRNIRSRDLGLAGSAGCRISWAPFRFGNEKKRASLISVDASLAASHDIGETSFRYSTNPVWDTVYESEETKRLRQLIPSQGEFFGRNVSSDNARTTHEMRKEGTPSCVFPVLQPVKALNHQKGDSRGKGGGGETVELDSWQSTSSALVVEVRFHDVLNKLPGFDDILGEVSIPLSQIIDEGEIRGWFRVVDPGVQAKGSSILGVPNISVSTETPTATLVETTYPEIYLEVVWVSPETSHDNFESEREASIVVAEELIRSASQSKNSGLDLMGTSIGAFNTVTGLSGNVHTIQNALASALDTAESIRNAFNFTDPHKSSILLCALVLLWLFLAIVPLRLLILFGGLAMYAVTFQATYLAKDKGQNEEIARGLSGLETERPSSPVSAWIMNAIRGLPTDEDLRKAYFWESIRVGEEARAALANQKRTARLQKLWRAQWHACIQLKTYQGHLSSMRQRDWHWTDAFAIVQGRRFLWWPSARDFDDGEAPTGCIFLAGHAGLAGLSPLEMRQLDAMEKPRVTCIFGRGLKQQEKLTILTETVQSKEALETAVLEAALKED